MPGKANSTLISKRGLDLTLALVLAVPAAAICLMVSPVIRRDGGPVIFRQVRLGTDGRPFTVYKLRTMLVGTGDSPSHETPTSAINPVGRTLRRLKIDELPQILNVLRGEMSFVGPRPGLPQQTELARERRSRGVDSLTPGITGVAQVRGLDMSQPAALARADAEYLGPWSLRRDLRLLWATVRGGGRGDAAMGARP